MVAMLLGPASCAEPQTPTAAPDADRPRSPDPPERPAIASNGLAAAAGPSVADAWPDAGEAAAAEACAAAPGSDPAGGWLAWVEPFVPVGDPDPLPEGAAPDGDCAPAGEVEPDEPALDEGVPDEEDGAADREGSGAREGCAVPEEVGAGAG
jgi:hypothetical protein